MRIDRQLNYGRDHIRRFLEASAPYSRLLAVGRQPSCIQVDSAHIRGFTRPGLMRFLEAGFPGGYRLEEFAGANSYPLPAVLAGRLARTLPGMSVGIFFHLVKQVEYQSGFVDLPGLRSLETVFKTDRARPK